MASKTYREYAKRWKTKTGYRARILCEAVRIRSDGCSNVPDFFRIICFEHDIHYGTHVDFFTGEALEQLDADNYLKWGIQVHSWFGEWSPLAWWRWKALSDEGLDLGDASWRTGPERLQQRLGFGVRLFGDHSWNG